MFSEHAQKGWTEKILKCPKYLKYIVPPNSSKTCCGSLNIFHLIWLNHTCLCTWKNSSQIYLFARIPALVGSITMRDVNRPDSCMKPHLSGRTVFLEESKAPAPLAFLHFPSPECHLSYSAEKRGHKTFITHHHPYFALLCMQNM